MSSRFLGVIVVNIQSFNIVSIRLKLAYQLAEVPVLIYGIVAKVVTVYYPTSDIVEALLLIKKFEVSKVNQEGFVVIDEPD